MTEPPKHPPTPAADSLAPPDLEGWQIEAQLPDIRRADQHDLAAALGERLLEIREATLGPTHAKTVQIAADLAESYFQLSRHERAAELLERALRAHEADPAPDPLALGLVVAQLAKVQRARGSLDQAEALYNRALDLFKSVQEAAPEVALSAAEGAASALHGLSIVLESRDQLGEAEAACRAALDLREKLLGGDAILVAESLNSLAVLHRKKGELDEAERLYSRALAIREARDGRDHPGLASTLTNLAILHTEKGEHARAGEVLARVGAVLEARGGAPDALSSAFLGALANHHEALGETERAIDAARRSLALSEELLGPSHPSVALALNNLASKLVASKKHHAEAEPLLRRALTIVGETRVAVTFRRVWLNLAALRMAAGDLDEAEALLNRALAAAREDGDAEHPDAADALLLLSRVAEERGDLDGALERMLPAFQIRSKRPNIDHAIADTTRMGALLLAAGDPEGASQMLRDALGLASGARGKDHPSVAHLIFLAAKVAVAQKNPKHALFCAGRALEIEEKAKGRLHQDLVEVLHLMGEVQLELSKLAAAEASFQRIGAIYAASYPPDSEAQGFAPALLGDVAMKRKAYGKAAELYDRSLAIAEGVFGKRSLRLQVVLDKAAEAHLKNAAFARAEELSLRLLAIYEEVTEPDAAITLPSVRRLATVYLERGDEARAMEMLNRTTGALGSATREIQAETSRIKADLARRKGQS